jgi:pimeloyl-ACP methyl ester carboxylesterase
MAALRWHGCGTHGARCSSLRVPLNWSHPDRASIAIGVTELRASGPAPSLGVLFFSPGGPGGGDRQIVRDDARQYFSAAIRRRFDIVGVDPRGVSPSRPAIRCGPPTRSTTVTETSSTRAGYLRLQAYDRRVGRACLTHTGPLLDHVDTVSAARDLDAVRAVLHVRRVSWFGVSYGTLLGATYAHLVPAHVRAAVLDGTLDHTVGSARLALDEARSAESEFGRFAHWCDTHARCALHGRDVGATYRALLTRARRHPVPAPGFAHGATADEIGYGTYGLMEIRARGPLIAEGIAAAVAPHPNAGLFIRAGVPEDAAYRATTCLDSPSSIHDYAQFRSLLGAPAAGRSGDRSLRRGLGRRHRLHGLAGSGHQPPGARST